MQKKSEAKQRKMQSMVALSAGAMSGSVFKEPGRIRMIVLGVPIIVAL